MDEKISAAVQAILDARPRFKVGDRVRVTGAIGECRCEPRWMQTVGHEPEEVGMTGQVAEYQSTWPAYASRYELPADHPVTVRWGRPTRIGQWMTTGGAYAPTELEPIP